MSVLVVTKDSIQQSNSTYAQGGIAGVLSPEDRFENHIEDTLTAGAGLCDRDIVEMVVREAPDQIDDLIRWGTHFDEEDGHSPDREGGHSHRRIVHALGDATGFEVMRAIIERAQQGRQHHHLGPHLHPRPADARRALRRRPGAAGRAQDKLLIWAKQTILASGGAGMVYRETTNPPVATGDGMAAAYRAGAELRDMEFMQFHPTVLYVAGSSRYPHQRGGARRGRLPARQERRPLHAGRGPARRAGHARRGRPGHRPHAWNGRSIPTSTSTCRTSTRPRCAQRFPGIDKVCRELRPGHHPRPDPGAAGRPLHDRRRDGRRRRAAPRCRVCGRPAR